MLTLSPSLLSADFANLERDVRMLNGSAADWIHCDVMDGRFVPNISFGLPVIKAVKRVSKLPLDVHLMILEPEKYVSDFSKAGADILTIHQEACLHLDRTLHSIRESGMKAGVSLNPSTGVDVLRDVLHLVDMVLIMSVNPGFGGQKFIPNALKKIERLKELQAECGGNFMIQVDGGINMDTGRQCIEAGADCLVAGSFVFDSPDPVATISNLKSLG